jgi:hypothetical protein
VDLDVRKLEVQHLREALNSRADEVFTLENRKLQLEQSLKERRHEISIHKCVASSTAAGRPYVSTEDSRGICIGLHRSSRIAGNVWRNLKPSLQWFQQKARACTTKKSRKARHTM